jgi:hypothetical protein
MNLIGFLFLLAASAALLTLPRRWAPLPLMAGASYMTLAQGIQMGPFYFTLVRLLILVGFIRVVLRGEKLAGGLMGMDKLMLAWAAWALICPVFREEPAATLNFHLGRAYTYLGLFFLIRCFCQEWEDVVGLVKMTAIVLVPVALEMVSEQITGHNLFSALGGVDAEPALRNGRLRSQGPFAHSILAGTVGAVCAPLMIGLWRLNRTVAAYGLAACALMVVCSASSGPLLSLIFALAALAFWRWRHLSRRLFFASIAAYLVLELVMTAPAYYLLARIDLTGSSASYHRSAIIDSGIKYLNEWWLAGTDYTRHWMPYGVPWSDDHADITNHYLAQGVMGGLPLMLTFVFLIGFGFRYVGRALDNQETAPSEVQFMIWAFGCSLFAHASTCISVAIFDQSVFFLYSTLAVTASLQHLSSRSEEDLDTEGEPGDPPILLGELTIDESRARTRSGSSATASLGHW